METFPRLTIEELSLDILDIVISQYLDTQFYHHGYFKFRFPTSSCRHMLDIEWPYNIYNYDFTRRDSSSTIPFFLLDLGIDNGY